MAEKRALHFPVFACVYYQAWIGFFLVCVSVRVCAHVCVRVCMCECARVRACARVRVYMYV